MFVLCLLGSNNLDQAHLIRMVFILDNLAQIFERGLPGRTPIKVKEFDLIHSINYKSLS